MSALPDPMFGSHHFTACNTLKEIPQLPTAEILPYKCSFQVRGAKKCEIPRPAPIQVLSRLSDA